MTPQHLGRTILITGANAGIGKETARQLALRDDTAKVILACRNEVRAHAARKDLEAATGRSIFEIVIVDMADLKSVRAAVSALNAPVDAVIMNAGGTGGRTPSALTAEGATQVFAVNVLGHAVLLDELITANKLTDAALLVGSEAARGVPKLRMKRPSFATSSVEEFASVIDGSYFRDRKFSPALAYGQAKYLGALWMAALARHHPELRFITMSPGNTAGTELTRDMPLPQRILIKHVVMRIAPLLKIAHPLAAGAQRLVDGITDLSLHTRVFYASAETKITGPVIDQAELLPDLADPIIQDNAAEAIHRFIA
ncbi:SDR family NAD(P)-dependent oxidoreductase [uncultured Mycobacterium sp.]|uniref:SDR family NAD(P)-dependent oxidoreductase n=1 Tax=uncultured Mycobacterium sp. TaxID=171292 RepID=UPI0035CB432D